jgi:gamma-glutamyl-gamma-aminobutyrate hydrolase PuuD
VVLVPACNRMLGEHPFHIVGRKYVDAVRLAGALPLVVPRRRGRRDRRRCSTWPTACC